MANSKLLPRYCLLTHLLYFSVSISEDFMINQELPEVPRDDQSSKMNNYIIEV